MQCSLPDHWLLANFRMVTHECMHPIMIYFSSKDVQNGKPFLQPAQGRWLHLKVVLLLLLTVGLTARIVYVAYSQSSMCVARAAIQPPPPSVNTFLRPFLKLVWGFGENGCCGAAISWPFCATTHVLCSRITSKQM